MRNSTGCVGCDFVAQFSPHDGGYCLVHGDIPPVEATALSADPYDDLIESGGLPEAQATKGDDDE